MSDSDTSPRATRADAARNRAKLLDAAKAVFGAGGADASLEAVARRAGLGVGTLYRHFPTREALFEAVYRREVEDLSALAERLMQELEPGEALRRWVRANIAFIATKKGMAKALALAAYNKDLSAYSFARMTQAVALLLARARQVGILRADISPEDLLRGLFGFCMAHDGPDWQATALRLIEVFLDGLLAPP